MIVKNETTPANEQELFFISKLSLMEACLEWGSSEEIHELSDVVTFIVTDDILLSGGFRQGKQVDRTITVVSQASGILAVMTGHRSGPDLTPASSYADHAIVDSDAVHSTEVLRKGFSILKHIGLKDRSLVEALSTVTAPDVIRHSGISARQVTRRQVARIYFRDFQGKLLNLN